MSFFASNTLQDSISLHADFGGSDFRLEDYTRECKGGGLLLYQRPLFASCIILCSFPVFELLVGLIVFQEKWLQKANTKTTLETKHQTPRSSGKGCPLYSEGIYFQKSMHIPNTIHRRSPFLLPTLGVVERLEIDRSAASSRPI